MDRLRSNGFLSRLRKELMGLSTNPPEGITSWPRDETTLESMAQEETNQGFWIDTIIYPSDQTPYAGGKFQLECCISRDYPFSPPHCRFVTPIYHPNIDSNGRICVDILKEGTSSGMWRASYNLRTVFSIIRQLLSEPNPDDPLDAQIAQEYLKNRALFEQKARSMTQQHAITANSETPTDDRSSTVKETTVQSIDHETQVPSLMDSALPLPGSNKENHLRHFFPSSSGASSEIASTLPSESLTTSSDTFVTKSRLDTVATSPVKKGSSLKRLRPEIESEESIDFEKENQGKRICPDTAELDSATDSEPLPVKEGVKPSLATEGPPVPSKSLFQTFKSNGFKKESGLGGLLNRKRDVNSTSLFSRSKLG